MDKQSYARYLLHFMNDEMDSDESDIDEAQFYGYFQMYMPDGKGVEATFEPLNRVEKSAMEKRFPQCPLVFL